MTQPTPTPTKESTYYSHSSLLYDGLTISIQVKGSSKTPYEIKDFKCLDALLSLAPHFLQLEREDND